MYSIVVESNRKPLPFLGFTYSVSKDGGIFKHEEKITLDQFNKEIGVSIKDENILVAIAYYNFLWHPKNWDKLEVTYKNNVRSITSMILKPIEPVECLTIPGFYHIPYFGRYVINKHGEVINLTNGKPVINNLNTTGYYTARTKNDNDFTKNNNIHRLMGFTFLPYDDNVKEMTINHIDHNKINNCPENLEWVTSGENTVLNAIFVNNWVEGDTTPIQVKDFNTNTIIVYPDIVSVAEALEISISVAIGIAKSRGLYTVAGYQIRPLSNDPWIETEKTIPWNERKKGRGLRKKPQFIVTKPDGTEINCGSREAARYLGLTRTSLQRSLREGRNYGPNKGFTVRRVKEEQ